jgi:hypothetical protein
MRQSDFCYFHEKLHKPTRGVERRKLKFSAIEDSAGIRTAVVQTLNALMGKRIDAKQAGLALHGIQIVAQRVDDDRSSPRDTVRDIIRSRKGDELAPALCVKEKGWGKSYEDCSECPHRETCGNLEDDEEQGEEKEEEEEVEEEESGQPAEASPAMNVTAASAEDKSSQSAGQLRIMSLEDTTAANFNQVIESMSPIALLKTYLKLTPTG